MKIGVCIKQVPARDSPLTPSDGEPWILEEALSFEICESDDYALEAALQLNEQHGGEVLAVSLGPERAEEALRTALAKGADRAIHITDQQVHQLDPLQVAGAIAAVAHGEDFDVILTGVQSDDQGFGQTGVILAELLGLPHATVVVGLKLEATRLRVRRELEAGWFQTVELPLPAVLTIQSGINKPRYATLKGIMAAKAKELRTLSRAEIAPAELVSSQRTIKIYAPEQTKRTEFLEGSAAEQAAALLRKLKYDARVV